MLKVDKRTTYGKCGRYFVLSCFCHSPEPATSPLSDLQTLFPRTRCSWRWGCCRSRPGESRWLAWLQHGLEDLSPLLRSCNWQNNTSLCHGLDTRQSGSHRCRLSHSYELFSPSKLTVWTITLLTCDYLVYRSKISKWCEKELTRKTE